MRAFQSESRYGANQGNSPAPEQLTPLQLEAQQRSDAKWAEISSRVAEKQRIAEAEYHERIKTLTIDQRITKTLEFLKTQKEPINKTDIAKGIFVERDSLDKIVVQLMHDGSIDDYKKITASGKLSVAKYFVIAGRKVNTESFVKVDV